MSVSLEGRTLKLTRGERRQRRQWCGPAALAMLARKDYCWAERQIRLANPHLTGKPLRGLHTNAVVQALKRFDGVQIREITRIVSVRLFTKRSWNVNELAQRKGTFLVVIRGHFLVIHNHRIYENSMASMRGKGCPRTRYSRKNARIVRAWIVKRRRAEHGNKTTQAAQLNQS